MKRIFALSASIMALSALTSCEYFYSLDLENQFEKGIYIWSQETGLKTRDNPTSLDELDSKWCLNYIEPGDMGSFADMMGWKNESSQSIVNGAFANTDTLMIAIFDAEELDSNWGKGKMSDYVIQKYWLAKDDVIEIDNKTLKRISFPPNEGMKQSEWIRSTGPIPPSDNAVQVDALEPPGQSLRQLCDHQSSVTEPAKVTFAMNSTRR